MTRYALQNAASVAGLILTMVSEIPYEKKAQGMPVGHQHGGGMGDMY